MKHLILVLMLSIAGVSAPLILAETAQAKPLITGDDHEVDPGTKGGKGK
jgi:hypothetical protein